MSQNSVEEIINLDASKFRTDFAYAAEMVCRHVHLKVNESLGDLLPENTLETLKKHLAEENTTALMFTIESSTEKAIHNRIHQELIELNERYDNRFSTEQILGLGIHLKQFITPYNNNLSKLWHYRFNFLNLNESIAKPLLTCVAVRLWNEMHTDQHIFTTNIAMLFGRRFKGVFDALYSITPHTSEQDKEEIRKLIDGFLPTFVEGRMGKNHKLSNTNVFMYRLPPLMLEEFPVNLRSHICRFSTRLFITPVPEYEKLPNLSAFLSQHEQSVRHNTLSPLTFREWCNNNMEQAILFITTMLSGNKTNFEVGIPRDKLKVSMFPFGMHYALSSLAVVASFMNASYGVMQNGGDEQLILASEYIDLKDGARNETWEAVAHNLINFLSDGCQNKFSDEYLRHVVKNQLYLFNYILDCGLPNSQIDYYFENALMLFKLYQKTPMEEKLLEKMTQWQGSSINPADFYFDEQKPMS